MSPNFSVDYNEAREKFLEAARSAGARLDQLKIKARGARGESLTIDIAILGDPNAKKVFLHTSGVHGVEGFAGSAVQIAALDRKPKPIESTGLIFVHILNPYGMSWLRRVNEENVDLNRNFLEPDESYSGPDDSYALLDRILNAPSSETWFWLQLFYKLSRVGFTALKKAIVQGQYDFPEGIFFGGRHLQESAALYKAWLQRNTPMAKTVVALDVHTGLGPFAHETLFLHTNRVAPEISKEITPLSDTIGYKVRGGMESLTSQVFAEASWIHFTQEFGTQSMLQVLRGLRQENLDFRSLGKSAGPSLSLKKLMSPDNPVWQAAVVEKGLATLFEMLAWLEAQSIPQST